MAALGGLVAATPLVDAENPAPDPSPHLLVIPNDADGVRALAESDVRTVARYGDFTLVEARGSDEEELRRAGAKRRDDMRHVRLGGKLLDPADRRTLASKKPRHGDEELVLVQFVGPVKDAWFQRLNGTGGQVVGYVAQNGYIVHATGEAIERLADLVGTRVEVRAVMPIEAADKYEGAAPPSGDVTFQTVAGDVGADARAAADAAGRRLRHTSTVRGVATQYLRLGASDAADLAGDPAVVAIGRYVAPVLHDERVSQIAAGNLSAGIPTAPTYLNWLTSEGFGAGTFDFVVDVEDTGLDDGSTAPAHPDFYVEGTKAKGSRVAYVRDWSPDGDASADGPPTTPPRDKANDDCWGHGTNVASILAGYNAAGGSSNGTNDSTGFNYGLGVAPRVRLGSSKLFGCVGGFASTSLTAIAATAHRSGARISNHSWGDDASVGYYSPEARELDALVRDADPLRPDDPGTGANEFDPGTPGNQQLVEVVSAGNEGGSGYTTVTPPGTAKNVITVGASENVRPGFTDGCGYASSAADNADHVAAFSSRGPTKDLRQKPDLVAPGTHVVGARPAHDAYFNGTTLTPAMICNPIFPSGTQYNLVTGTSQAAPVVSGAAALVRDWYARQPDSGGPPSPALTKAILIDGATDLAGAVDGKGGTLPGAPSMEAGWGRPDLSRAFGNTQREYLDQTELIPNSGQSRFHSYAVASPGAPVRVTLAWTDAVPAATGVDAFVNDLDLTVVAGGRTYRGNVMDGSVSIPGGAADPRNNVEGVVLPAGLVGRISVEVGGTSVGGDGVPGNGDLTDQDFALVVSNADEVDAPVLSTQSVSVSDGGSGGDNDSVLESGEEVDLKPVVRNSGTDVAVDVSGAAGDGDGLTFEPPGSSGFPDIAPDSAEAAVNDYGAAYSAATPCGSDATATLTMTASGEQQELPIVIPTGEGGATLTSSAAGPEVPRAIPDNNPVGVASALSVTARGRIRDLNVRIGGITHPWVGDLAISLTGPDGTTVTLARHPGGPDNSADNFTNVTFDDEAGGTIPSTGPVAGQAYRPQGDQLSRFDGKDRRGTWTLRVRDLLAGNTGTLTAWSAISRRALCDFDLTAPALQRTAFPGSPDNASATFAFESPDSDARFECRLDGGAYTACTSPQVLNGLSDGQHTFTIQAIDGSGNESAEIPHVWQVDTVPPQTMIDSGPAAFVASDDPTFSFSSDSAVLRFKCSLDGEAFSECTSATSYSDIGEGPHTFRVRAEDLAGNVDPTPATHNFTVDTVGPQPQVTGPVSPTKDRTPILRGTVARQPGDTLAVTVELFAGADASGSPVQAHHVTGDGQGNWAVQVSPTLALGQYTVRARQVDQAGNPGQQTRTFTVVDDDEAPVVDLRAPGRGSTTSDSTPRVAGVAGTSDGDEPTVVVRLYRGSLVGGLPAHSLVLPVAAASGAFAADTPRLADGQWTAVVGQLDSAGNAGSSAPAGFTVAAAAARPPASAPGLIAVSRIEELGAVRRGGLPVLLSCAAACSARARLTISASGARRVGLSSVLIGRSSTKLAGAGQKRMSVRLRPAMRRALASASGARVLLRVRLDQGGEHASLRGWVSLRNGRLERVVRRGHALFVATSEGSRVAGSLRAGGRTIASGVRSGVRSTQNLVLRVPPAQRPRLLRLARLRAALVVTARGEEGAESTVRVIVRLIR